MCRSAPSFPSPLVAHSNLTHCFLLVALPLKLVQAHDSPVRCLTFARAPQTDASGSYRYDWEQHLVVSVAQGRLRVVDLRDNDGVSLQLKASRGVSSTCDLSWRSTPGRLTIAASLDLAAPILYGTATSLQNGSVVAADSDFAVYMSGLRPKALGSMRRAASHQGTVWVRQHRCPPIERRD